MKKFQRADRMFMESYFAANIKILFSDFFSDENVLENLLYVIYSGICLL